MNQKKRSADEAFPSHSSHRLFKPASHYSGPSKVIDFPDDDIPKSTTTPMKSLVGGAKGAKQKATFPTQASFRTQVQVGDLPITAQKGAILDAIDKHDVLLLVGETGSGKSTQVPQYILQYLHQQRQNQHPHHHSQKSGGNAPCIAVTQPRRVAAISLAQRVASEMGVKVGREVGYSVRFDQKVTKGVTRVKYLTEGMLLREMLEDRTLRGYAVVVVDEVHERGVGVDLVLGVLRGLLRTGRGEKGGRDGKGGRVRGGGRLKVVVMSATGDVEGLRRFFEEDEGEGDGEVRGKRGNGGHLGNVEGEEEWSGFSDAEGDGHEGVPPLRAKQPPSVASIRIEGRQYPVTINYISSPVPDLLSACLDRIISIHTTTPLPGDILVFLKGQDQVEHLESLCRDYTSTINKPPPPGMPPSKQQQQQKIPTLQILPLFAALPAHLQSLIFNPTPNFTRKLILATNIAETSLTIPGITHVIDTGYRKQRSFRPTLNLESLLTVPISKSSARQRAGRAGRTAPGTCWRLYTRKTFDELKENDEPEILRADLAGVMLSLKALDIQDVLGFPYLTMPVRRNVEQALMSLLQLGAVDPTTGAITEVGKRMSRMPLTPRLARVLIESEIRGCLGEMVDLVSALSVENLWVSVNERSEDERIQRVLEERRRSVVRREGDHITLLKAVREYLKVEGGDRGRRVWCESLGVSKRAMSNVLDVRKQLRNLVGLRDEEGEGREIAEDTATMVLKCLLTGFLNNVARLTSGAKEVATTKKGGFVGGHAQYITFSTNQQIWIHPSSTMFGRKVEAVVYTEFVFTQKPYARNVSAMQLVWVEELLRRGINEGNGMNPS